MTILVKVDVVTCHWPGHVVVSQGARLSENEQNLTDFRPPETEELEAQVVMTRNNSSSTALKLKAKWSVTTAASDQSAMIVRGSWSRRHPPPCTNPACV